MSDFRNVIFRNSKIAIKNGEARNYLTQLKGPQPLLKRASILLGGATLLYGCGASGEDDHVSPPSKDNGINSPLERRFAAAARFLSQATCGADADEIASVAKNGPRAWIMSQFTLPPSESCWDWLVSKGLFRPEYVQSQLGLDEAVWHRLVASQDQLRCRVALSLSEIFVAFPMGGYWNQFAIAQYMDMLCTHAFGNFRTLLEAVSLNLLTGLVLTSKGNRKEDPATNRAPDENFARELMQLFSIGLYELNQDGSYKLENGTPIATYTAEDVSELAKVFTGWDAIISTASPEAFRAEMDLNAAYHSTSPKQFLGTIIGSGADGKSDLKVALDTLFSHQNVGPFIGKQLIQRLVCSNPSPGYVERVARVFADNGKGVRGDMKSMILAILLDPEAQTLPSHPGAGKVREPILRLTQWIRAFHALNASSDSLGIPDLSVHLGQSPFRATSVFNFFRPQYVPPGSAIAQLGLVAPELQITDEVTLISYVNFMQGVIANNLPYLQASYGTERTLAEDARVLTEHLNILLVAGSLTRSTIDMIVASVETISQENRLARVYAAILLIMCSTEYLVQR
jgi:uncharacterized protein (DUF1800 family)